MSQVLIQQYLNQLQDLRKVSGTHRESVVREAFKDLLRAMMIQAVAKKHATMTSNREKLSSRDRSIFG
jgi:hypothetical protein